MLARQLGLRYEVNTTSAPVPYGVDEFKLAGLTAARHI